MWFACISAHSTCFTYKIIIIDHHRLRQIYDPSSTAPPSSIPDYNVKTTPETTLRTLSNTLQPRYNNLDSNSPATPATPHMSTSNATRPSQFPPQPSHHPIDLIGFVGTEYSTHQADNPSYPLNGLLAQHTVAPHELPFYKPGQVGQSISKHFKDKL